MFDLGFDMPRSPQDRPNIIIMYADDLGFGDIGCYGAKGLETPNIDRLSKEGIQFQQGYSTAATCTPSRYSLLTGAYPFRCEKACILPGDAPLIIDTRAMTFPKMMKKAGYATGVVGKWHLGLGTGSTDWNQPLKSTPLDVGFDESMIMAATNDRVPCVYIEGNHVVGLDPNDPIEVKYQQDNPWPELPSGRENPELLKMVHSHGHDNSIVNGVGRIGFMRGGEKALWVDEDMAEVFLNRTKKFIKDHADEPFFLYQAFHQPHVPRLPNARFAGSTGLGPRGDVIAEMDWMVGETLDKLEELGIRDHTIIIFSSDNGPILDDGYEDQAVELCGSHRPAGPLRGTKYSLYDGGTHVPTLLSWRGQVHHGKKSEAIVNHVDFLASFAGMVGVNLEAGEAPDSQDVLGALLGKSKVGRKEMLLEGSHKTKFLRSGDWIFIPTHEGPATHRHTGIESGRRPHPQLFNVTIDVSQATDVAFKYPDRVKAMETRLEELFSSSSTR